jgi:hypothetical protein
MLITSSYPSAPLFHGHSTRKIHALIFTSACFRVLPRPSRIAFRRHSWSFANRLASLEAALRLATARFSSAGLLPYAVHPGFPESFRSQFHRTSDPPDDRPQAASAGDCRAGSRRDSATPRYCDFALVFEARSTCGSRRLSPHSAGQACHPTDEAVLLIFRHRRLATVKRIDQHPREENLTKLPRITYRRSFLQLIARCVAAPATPVVVADSGWFRSRVEDSLADPVASATE